jgi:hypothetical protein
LDENTYPTGVKVSDKDMKGLNLYPANFMAKTGTIASNRTVDAA